MIRILHIQETIGSGGVEKRRLSLSKLLNKDKFELKIICTFSAGGIKQEIETNGVEVIVIGQFKGVFDFKKHKIVQNIIENYKPHIIHGAVFEGVTMAAINGFLKKVPIIIIEETSDPQNRSWRGNLLMKFFSKISDIVIGVSPGVVEYLENILKLPNHKVLLLNNGVILPREVTVEEVTTLKLKLGINQDDIVIGSIGRMLQDEHKRFSDLINAFSIVSKNNDKVKLVLVGSGPELENYKKLSEDLALEDKIIFAGYQSDVSLYYKLMDVFSLVSAYEAFGLVLAEAMLSKLPIVATRVGGMKYIVEDNNTGFLVDKYDVVAIAEKLEILCSTSHLRKQFGNSGYSKAINNYTEERYVKEVENLYFKLVQNKLNISFNGQK